MGVSEASDNIQIKIKIPIPSQNPLVFPKTPNQDLKVMDVLKNQNREPKFRALVYQIQVTIDKSISRYKTKVRNLQSYPKPQIRT